MRHLNLVTTIACTFLATTAQGHDIQGVLKQEMTSATPQIQAATAVADVETRSVLANLRLWPVPRVLTICFIGGSADLRKRIAVSMRKSWPLAELTDGRLDFDKDSFTNAPDCPDNPTRAQNIRVAFKPGLGHWSYVGVDSLRYSPSMNFDGLSEAEADRTDFDRIVGHEFGHALGLEHEHQSPASPNCLWNFPYIRQHYQWNSDQEMYDNFNKLQDYLKGTKHAYIFSTYNKTSLMHYVFEPQAFLGDSPCFKKEQNTVPSDQDKNAIQIAYGPNALASQQTAKGAIPRMMNDPKFEFLKGILSVKQDLLTH